MKSYSFYENHPGYEIAKNAFIKSMGWNPEKLEFIEKMMAHSYGLVMVASKGNQAESVKFVCNFFKAEHLLEIFALAENDPKCEKIESQKKIKKIGKKVW